MKKYIYGLLFLTTFVNAQMQKTDSIGNFFVMENQLVWQKYYPLDDENELNDHLKSNHFTSNLDILNFQSSAQSNLSYIEGSNLPPYTSKGFEAFVVIDIIYDTYRVTVKQITFPDFIQTRYYNGIKENRGGTLEHYLLRTSDLEIKRVNSTYNLLDTFDNSFDAAFSLKSDW